MSRISTLVLLGLGLSCSVLASKTFQNVPFQLSAKNLPSMDPFGGDPDPYVIINYQNPPNPPLKLGETSKLADTRNPVWPEWFNVIYLNESSQTLTLDLYDEDIDSDDYMGAVTIRLQDVVTSFGGMVERDIVLNNSTMGQMIITANITKC